MNPSGTVTRSELGFDTEPTGELFVTFAWKTTPGVLAAAVVGLVIASAIVLWLAVANPGMAVATSRAATARPPIQRPFFETETVCHPIPPRYVDIRLATRLGRMA